MATLGQFARNMRARAKRVPYNVKQIKMLVGQDVLQAVVTATPIDTGQARFNWNVAFNSPDYTTDEEGFADYVRRGDWLGRMATSLAVLARVGEKDTIYISNALPYIEQLNKGKSPQAGADYVRRAALVAVRRIARGGVIR